MARYRINVTDIQSKSTMAEQLDLARISGMSIDEARAIELGQFGSLPMTAMIAIVYILIRRIDPRFTEADMSQLDWEDIDFIQPSQNGHDGAADPPQPLQPLKSGGRKSSARSVATTG